VEHLLPLVRILRRQPAFSDHQCKHSGNRNFHLERNQFFYHDLDFFHHHDQILFDFFEQCQSYNFKIHGDREQSLRRPGVSTFDSG
jgi:hypothetical protein